MHPTAQAFKTTARQALDDSTLQQALANMKSGFIDKRLKAIERLPEFEALRDQGKAIKDHTLAHLDFYLERFEEQAVKAGGKVHWCANAAQARAAVLAICEAAGARTVTKGKSMISEEIALNDFLEAHGIEPVETDLGEYIVQLRHEPPSHILAPAVHLTRGQIEGTFRESHQGLDPARVLEEPRQLVDEARRVLRARFLAADVGITGANFLIAETGSSVIVTNEGNGDLTQLLPRVHIVLASLEKIVPTLEDAATLLRLLGRSATGQEMSVYTTFSTGPKRADDADGPAEYHVILLDNGRSRLLGTEMQDILRCIRCGACLNHCPVYQAVGGYTYGWVYPGPMGAVLTPVLIGIDQAPDLPQASTFCGRCESICPMRIPLPKMLRHWRDRAFAARVTPAVARWGVKAWAWLARRPRLYHWLTDRAMPVLARLGRRHGGFYNLPLAGGWTATRDLPAPEGPTFHALWAKRRGGVP